MRVVEVVMKTDVGGWWPDTEYSSTSATVESTSLYSLVENLGLGES